MKRYAEISDIISLGKNLTPQETETAENLLDMASAKLRVIAKKYGKNLDEMAADEDFALSLKNVVIQAVLRAMSNLSDADPAITQGTQSALGYSATITYLNAGQSLYFLRNELKELGIIRQIYGALEMYNNAAD